MVSEKTLSDVIRDWAEVFMHRSGRDFKRFMATTGLSFSQINILMRLFHSGCSSVSEIGEQMGFTNAAASQAVDRLVQLGLVVRDEHPADRRTKRLELSPAGRELIQEGIRARFQWLEDLTRSIPAEQQKAIIETLTLLTEAARQDTE